MYDMQPRATTTRVRCPVSADQLPLRRPLRTQFHEHPLPTPPAHAGPGGVSGRPGPATQQCGVAGFAGRCDDRHLITPDCRTSRRVRCCDGQSMPGGVPCSFMCPAGRCGGKGLDGGEVRVDDGTCRRPASSWVRSRRRCGLRHVIRTAALPAPRQGCARRRTAGPDPPPGAFRVVRAGARLQMSGWGCSADTWRPRGTVRLARAPVGAVRRERPAWVVLAGQFETRRDVGLRRLSSG